jgi:hypothetical protein
VVGAPAKVTLFVRVTPVPSIPTLVAAAPALGVKVRIP